MNSQAPSMIRGGGPPLWVSVLFHATSLRKSQVQDISLQLAQLVHRIVPTQCPGTAEAVYDCDDSGCFPEAVASVTVHRLPQLVDSLWSATSCGFVHYLKAEEVAKVVTGRWAAAEEYGRSFDEIWLLIAVDMFRVASMLQRAL